LFVGALVKRINEHVIRPAAESFVGAVIDALPQSAVEQLSNSRGFESAMEAGRTVSGGIMHGSQEALGMLSPMDGAADKLLKGDLGGAGNEAMLEAFGGRVFKAAGKGIAAVKRHAGKLDEAVGALSHADDAATATATGVRESIEEASSVLAKEGGGVAKTTPTSLWSKAEFNGTRVYQRNDLIDAALVDARGRTNLQRMQSGLAPIGPDGKSLNLHHTIHSADGPLAEMTATFHQQNSRVIHINPNTIPSGIDRRAFDAFRRDYWMNRANGFSP
jgi:hypothetical protein